MTSSPGSERLLLIEEVADRLRTPPATLRYWRHIGSGPASAKLGRRLVYRESDVTAWLEKQFIRPSDGAA